MKISGVIVEGYRVASGDTKATPYPQGTIAMQAPHFKAGGMDIGYFHQATLNISIEPHRFKIIKPLITLEHINWSDIVEPETFSFVECRLITTEIEYSCLVYYPHPETKPDHFQEPTTLELLAPFIKTLRYGDTVQVAINPETIEIS